MQRPFGMRIRAEQLRSLGRMVRWQKAALSLVTAKMAICFIRECCQSEAPFICSGASLSIFQPAVLLRCSEPGCVHNNWGSLLAL